MRFLKWIVALLVAFGLGIVIGSKVTLRREWSRKAKEIRFVNETRLAESGLRTFITYKTNRNDAAVYLLSEHVADLEKALKAFPQSIQNDRIVMLFARHDLVGALVVNYGRLAILKEGTEESEKYSEKALALSTAWSPAKKYSKVVDKNSLRAYVKAKDTAGEFW